MKKLQAIQRAKFLTTTAPLVLVFGLCGLLSSCSQNSNHMPLADLHAGANSGQSLSGTGPYYQTDIKPIISQYCVSCHGPGSGRDWTNYSTFRSEQSKLETLVLGANPTMPLGNPGALPSSAKSTLQQWIAAGMPEAPAQATNPTPTPGPTPDPTPTPGPTPGPVPMPTDAQVQSCTACHGNLGQSTTSMFPKLAAQSQSYLANQLTAFHDKTRADSDATAFMWPVAAVLSPADITALANYFSSQAPDVKHQTGDPARIAKGKDLFNNGAPDKGVPACASCHGAQGEGMATFPRLAGQFSEYIAKQLNYFKAGTRANDPTMPVFAKQLSDDDITNLSQYVNSL